MQPLGYQVAKSIYLHAKHSPPDTFKRIGKSGFKRAMSQEEAARIVQAAETRIALVDEGD